MQTERESECRKQCKPVLSVAFCHVVLFCALRLPCYAMLCQTVIGRRPLHYHHRQQLLCSFPVIQLPSSFPPFPFYFPLALMALTSSQSPTDRRLLAAAAAAAAANLRATSGQFGLAALALGTTFFCQKQQRWQSVHWLADDFLGSFSASVLSCCFPL